MPGTNSRKHVIPLGSEASFTRATIFKQFGQSINDVVPVANAAERAQVVADLTADGRGPTSARPLVVIRADARGLHRMEYTYDGTVWLPGSGELAFATEPEAASWAMSNGGLVATGDSAVIAGVRAQWTGTKWDYVESFTDLLFGNGFTAYTGSGWSGVRVWRRGGIVFGNGAATNQNAWAAGTAVCNVPAGMRPPVQWQGASCTVEVGGNVTAGVAGAAGGAFSFSFCYPVTY